MTNPSLDFFMEKALQEAEKSYQNNEVPVGAVITYQDKIISTGQNLLIKNNDPTAHAEIIAIKNASQYLNNYRLINCDLYVTLEPCIMCLGAIFHTRIRNLYFGAHDLKTGACGGLINLKDNKQLNHHCNIYGGIAESKSRKILQDFFKEKRIKKTP